MIHITKKQYPPPTSSQIILHIATIYILPLLPPILPSPHLAAFVFVYLFSSFQLFQLLHSLEYDPLAGILLLAGKYVLV